jgi:hypothetical protein
MDVWTKGRARVVADSIQLLGTLLGNDGLIWTKIGQKYFAKFDHAIF